MKMTNGKLGFTLIELLVVITIIGILATGAVNIFTSQLQKARDSTRISDMNALRMAIEQYYQDTSNYPAKGATFSGAAAGIGNYLQRFPIDPRTTNSRTVNILGVDTYTVFEYLFNVGPDSNSIPLQRYEVSTTFENDGNISSRAANNDDGGNDEARLEVGVGVEEIITSVANTTIASTVLPFSCVDIVGASLACDNTPGNIMVIRR